VVASTSNTKGYRTNKQAPDTWLGYGADRKRGDGRRHTATERGGGHSATNEEDPRGKMAHDTASAIVHRAELGKQSKSGHLSQSLTAQKGRGPLLSVNYLQTLYLFHILRSSKSGSGSSHIQRLGAGSWSEKKSFFRGEHCIEATETRGAAKKKSVIQKSCDSLDICDLSELERASKGTGGAI